MDKIELKHEIRSNFNIDENTEFSEVANYKDGVLMSILNTLIFNTDSSRIGISIPRDENNNLKFTIFNIIKDIKQEGKITEREAILFIIDTRGRRIIYTEGTFKKPKTNLSLRASKKN